MNYRHAYHAGNHADVLKHIVLTRILAYMVAKDKPLAVLDAHAGTGVYDLTGPEAFKTGEGEEGIQRLLRADMPADVHNLLQPYLAILAQLNGEAGDRPGTVRSYCGSPEIAARLTRPGDRLIFNELHPADCALLGARYATDARVRVTAVDARQAVKATLPFPERRGVVIIDPPYERPDETETTARMAEDALRRLGQAVVLVWYPVTTTAFAETFVTNMQRVTCPELLHVQLLVREPHQQGGLSGSGLVVFNPPWKLQAECDVILPCLAAQLGKGRWGRWRVETLTPPVLPSVGGG